MPYLYSYKMASDSSKKIARALNIKRIKTEGRSAFKGNKDKIVINWGSSTMNEEAKKCKVVNNPEAVAIASDKLKFFKAILNWNTHKEPYVEIPNFTTSREEATRWIEMGYEVVCRTVLKGHSGEGIVLIGPENIMQLPKNCPLFVMYYKKKSEYRVHVIGNEVKDVVRKARRRELPDDQINWKIRNHANGFVFSRNEDLGEVPNVVKQQAVNAVKAIGLDFGAVDVIYNDKTKKAYVLEINTAPGLEGETVNIYTNGLANLLNVRKGKKFQWFDIEAIPQPPQGQF